MNEANLKLNFFIVIIYSAITLMNSGVISLLFLRFIELSTTFLGLLNYIMFIIL